MDKLEKERDKKKDIIQDKTVSLKIILVRIDCLLCFALADGAF